MNALKKKTCSALTLIEMKSSKFCSQIMKKKQKSFTLIEMLIVLGIISILLLLFVPNLIKEKAQVQKTGDAAVVKVVESQAQLYELDHEETPTLSDLLAADLITKKQAESYDAYYSQNKNEARDFSD